MSNFWNDPFGIRLINCNPPPAQEEENPPPAQETNNNGCYYYYTTPTYYVPQPQTQYFFYPAVNMVPAVNYCQPIMQYTQVAPAEAAPPSVSQPPPHECVSCTARNKCKKCIKEEEKHKNYVTSPSFWNPRSKYTKSIFSNKTISSS